MCTVQYSLLGQIFYNDTDKFIVRFHQRKIKKPYKEQSRTSSLDPFGPDISLYLPLDDHQIGALPKFNDFNCIGCLGDGGFAQVYCVQHTSTEKYYAVKVADGTLSQARQQLEIEKRILFHYYGENPYMIKPYCAFHQGSALFLVLELVEHGTLYDMIQKRRMTEDDIRYYLAQIICILQYLHTRQIVYRDLKLEHAAISSDNSLRLIDFGLARLLRIPDETCHTSCGTPTYMAPEVRRLENGSSSEGYSYAVDFWALGIMFLQMLCGERVNYDPETRPNDNIATNEPENRTQHLDLPHHISSEAQVCLSALLEQDPKRRLGSPNSPHGLIRNHPFFKSGHSIDWQLIEEGVFKSSHSSQTIDVVSCTSLGQPLPNLKLDRSTHAKNGWIKAAQSLCTPEQDENFQLFDYIGSSCVREFSRSNIS